MHAQLFAFIFVKLASFFPHIPVVGGLLTPLGVTILQLLIYAKSVSLIPFSSRAASGIVKGSSL